MIYLPTFCDVMIYYTSATDKVHTSVAGPNGITKFIFIV